MALSSTKNNLGIIIFSVAHLAVFEYPESDFEFISLIIVHFIVIVSKNKKSSSS